MRAVTAEGESWCGEREALMRNSIAVMRRRNIQLSLQANAIRRLDCLRLIARDNCVLD